ncbi:type II toxin-antitoxin system PemK/MazF family toxin [Salicibibacter cibarius]|uniref:Type II toxin-antitoxin system PemK/MazF family toxin n=1 Tax=Salicibibacter cibarius TaxID=2743000 RepID=A0A7T7CA88_9BACI|nr:type II toxin-antitoxin system PemK/MazF family toxin [Salicibibacter cibarius]QQK74642.1 type II toxin-antitoxin system PemK/MazF family toxin [Salicibibacter cibarius]
MNEETKKQLDRLLDQMYSILHMVDNDEAVSYIEWMLQKAQLRYQQQYKKHLFPILYRHIYWAHWGINVGNEQDKHRPVLVIRSEKKSPICAVVPLTTQRLEDRLWYHIDLKGLNNTALVEHFRVISKDRIDGQLRKAGDFAKAVDEDMQQILKEIKRLYATPPPKRKK